ncbi:hypothetical protein LguiB_025658 [Lonicera macranthoides]
MENSDLSPSMPPTVPLSSSDLQSWRSKLDTQVKTYRDELSGLKQSLNVEVDQLRSVSVTLNEFQELRTTLQQQHEDVTASLRNLGLQDVSGETNEAEGPKVESINENSNDLSKEKADDLLNEENGKETEP